MFNVNVKRKGKYIIFFYSCQVILAKKIIIVSFVA